jgi:prepilin-type N-terminal cleavage/methylation domain-containing protein
MKRRSFTLIELLIVLVIIGIVVVLAVPQYKLFVIKAQSSDAKVMLRTIADAVWRYYIETGQFPSPEGPDGFEGFWSAIGLKAPSSKYYFWGIGASPGNSAPYEVIAYSRACFSGGNLYIVPDVPA